MKVSLGPLKLREMIVDNNTIDIIAPRSALEIKSKFFFGFGQINIQIVVTPENIYGVDRSFNALKFGPFIRAL